MKSLSTKNVFFIFLAFLYCLSVCSGKDQPATENNEEDDIFMKIMWECSKSEDMGICLKTKTVTFLDRLAKMKEPLAITEYLSLARNPKSINFTDPSLDKAEEDLNLIEDTERKNTRLDQIIWNRLNSILSTRTLQITISNEGIEGRKGGGGGGGKGGGKIFKKGGGLIMMAGMMGGMMMKMAMAKIALIAGKALMVAKIALVISLIIGLKKLVSSGGGGGHSEVVYTSADHHGGHGWQRKFAVEPSWDDEGAKLAYNAHLT